MAVIIPPGYAEVTHWMRQTPQTWEQAVVFGLDISAAGGDLSAVADAYISAFQQSTLLARQDSSIQNTRVVVRAGSDPSPGPVFEQLWAANGQLAITAPPCNLAVLVKKGTAFGGRANRGRTYWNGFLAESDVDEVGVLGGAQVAAIGADMTAFLSELEAPTPGAIVSCPMVILHDAGVGPLAPTPVTSYTVQSLAGTQRRRMRKS